MTFFHIRIVLIFQPCPAVLANITLRAVGVYRPAVLIDCVLIVFPTLANIVVVVHGTQVSVG
jgi:hypothetical protein